MARAAIQGGVHLGFREVGEVAGFKGVGSSL